jgi:glyoxylase I family protein
MKNQKIAGCGFHHVAIWTSNWEKSLDFYINGLGFNQKIIWGEEGSRGVMLDTGDGNYLEIFERDPAKQTVGEGSLLHLCFRSESVENAFKTAILAGGKEKLAPTVPDPFTKLGLTTKIAFIEGPDGEIVEFFESPDL